MDRKLHIARLELEGVDVYYVEDERGRAVSGVYESPAAAAAAARQAGVEGQYPRADEIEHWESLIIESRRAMR